jgi:hypothetical protein
MHDTMQKYETTKHDPLEVNPVSFADNKGRFTNRLRAILLHVSYYSIEPTTRLASDTGHVHSSISRLLSQRSQPSYLTAQRIAEAISKRSGIAISEREIFSPDGTYPTPSTCALLGCRGCLPPKAWNESTDKLKSYWKTQKPGDWCYFLGISRSQEQVFSSHEPINDSHEPLIGSLKKVSPNLSGSHI